jgi:hypothetical protein
MFNFSVRHLFEKYFVLTNISSELRPRCAQKRMQKYPLLLSDLSQNFNMLTNCNEDSKHQVTRKSFQIFSNNYLTDRHG